MFKLTALYIFYNQGDLVTFLSSYNFWFYIVVSRILRVHGSSGHEPNSKNLQNKQGTGGGVPSSLMLKLVKEIRSVLAVNSAGVFFHIPFLNVISLIYEE